LVNAAGDATANALMKLAAAADASTQEEDKAR